MFRKKYLTKSEIEDLINASSDEEETATLIRNADYVDLVSTVDDISDAEKIDDDVQVLNDQCDIMPGDVVGEIEVFCEFDECNKNMPAHPSNATDRKESDEEVVGPQKSRETSQKNKLTKKQMKPLFKAKWSKTKQISFSRQPVDVQDDKLTDIYKQFGMFFKC